MYKILHIPSARYVYKYEPFNIEELTSNNSKYIQCHLNTVTSEYIKELQNLLNSSTHYYEALDNGDVIILTETDGYMHTKVNQNILRL